MDVLLNYFARPQVECLLALAALERSLDRLQEAAEALEEAEVEIKAYPGGVNGPGLNGNEVMRSHRQTVFNPQTKCAVQYMNQLCFVVQ